MTTPSTALDRQHANEWLRIAYWAGPPLFCLLVYFWGLRAWYQQDDFVWLSQRFQVGTPHDFLRAVFGPSVHGTFRPVSERLFLLLAGKFFGTDAFPARLLVFLTQTGSILLLAAIVRRITGSAVAGFVASLIWIANGALAFPMAWSSSYMYVLCGFCLLLAFHFFERYIATGNPSNYFLQWAVFLFGFLVMETTIVYPAIASVYALLRARKYFLRTLPLFGASLSFLVLHSLLVPKQRTGAYSMHFDGALPKTLLTYWNWLLVPPNWQGWENWHTRPWMAAALVVTFSVAILGWAAYDFWRGSRLAALGLAVFLILLAPVLPLSQHVSYYYLTLPSMGLAFVGASAVAAGSSRLARIPAWALIIVFLLVQAPFAYTACKWWYDRSQRIRSIVMGVMSVHQSMPDKMLVLTNVDEGTLDSVFWDGGFRAFAVPDVYIDPAQRDELTRVSVMRDQNLEPFFMDAALFQRGLLRHKIAVLSINSATPLDVTPRFEAALQLGPTVWPSRIDVSNILSEGDLRGTWYQLETGHRWMGKSAGVVLAAPTPPRHTLHVSGYCAGALLANGSVSGRVSMDGRSVGELRLSRADASFEADFLLPTDTSGKPQVEVMIDLDHTFRPPGDGRDLGLSFGSFQIR
jgi:hypothetical protein